MTPEDELLVRALRRPSPPPDLVERVMGRVGRVGAASPGGSQTPPAHPASRQGLLALAAAAALLLAAGGGYYQHRQAETARRAAAELRTALHITTETLTMAVQRMNRPDPPRTTETER